MDKLLPRLPFAEWIDDGVDWLVVTFGTVFDGISDFLKGIVEGISRIARYRAFYFTCRVICLACVVRFHSSHRFIHINRLAVHRLLGLLVPNATNASSRTHLSILCANNWDSCRYLGITTSNSQKNHQSIIRFNANNAGIRLFIASYILL